MIRCFLAASLLSALFALLEPLLQTTLYTARLTTRPAPSRLAPPIVRNRPVALRDSWHAPRSGGRRHEGIDIFAPRGTPVLSTTEGVVAGIGSNRLGGTVVWVLGPGGQRHYYAHLARVSDIFRGQRIRSGTVLGYVGNTGNARGTPPHLHYGIYTRRGAINPYPLLKNQGVASRPGGAIPGREAVTADFPRLPAGAGRGARQP